MRVGGANSLSKVGEGGADLYIIGWFDGIVVVADVVQRPNRTLQSLCSL
jgi:hypothetical protein